MLVELILVNFFSYLEDLFKKSDLTLKIRIATEKKKNQASVILRYMRSDAYGPRRNLFSMACSSQLLARAMSNGGNPFLEGHGNLERTRKGSQGIEARSYEKKKKKS